MFVYLKHKITNTFSKIHLLSAVKATEACRALSRDQLRVKPSTADKRIVQSYVGRLETEQATPIPEVV